MDDHSNNGAPEHQAHKLAHGFRETCRILGDKSPTHVYGLINSGELTAYKDGARTMVTRESILALIERRVKEFKEGGARYGGNLASYNSRRRKAAIDQNRKVG
jgi:hypothetical protein